MLSYCVRNVSYKSRKILRNEEKWKKILIRWSSQQEVSKVAEEKSSKATTSVASDKKQQNYPFAKSLFLGKFDTDMLAFPEVLDKDKLETLNELVIPVEKFFEEKVDSKAIDANSCIPKETLQGLKDLGLFGQQVPEQYGGLGLNATEFARLAEITALDGGIAVTLGAHQSLGLKGILLNGTEEQKKKYLPRVASGEWIAGFCLTEPSSGSDAASIKTKAKLSDDGKTYILNGGKIWISNGGLADMFTVFAKTEHEDHCGKPFEAVTAFIVERGFGGVTNGKPEDKLGIRGSNTCEVHFENTPIPAENIIGELGGGFKVAMNVLNSGRFSMGSSSAGILKKLVKSATEHVINRRQFGKQLKDFDMIKEKFARLSVLIYAMESMAYHTAGIMDEFKDPDCAVEAAMVKVFSSEGCWHGVSECLQILGGLGYMKDYPYERFLRDSRIMMIFDGTNEILRLFISLMGLQYAGKELKETVKKLRNPFMNPGFIIKGLLSRRRHAVDAPKLNLGLNQFLHPTLKVASEQLEYCVLRLQYAVEVLLSRYGAKVSENQMELKRIADIAINIYAMTAVLSRASRSYCIGLQNADLEIVIANSFTDEAVCRVRSLVKDVELGPQANNDANLKRIADKVFDSNGYFPQHPLTRNY